MPRKDTSSKILIEEFLREHPGNHYSAGEILDQVKQSLPSINLSTVHRNLKALAKENRVSISDMGTGVPVFETTAKPHHHLICQQCGHTTEISTGMIQDLLESVREKYEFAFISTNHLVIYGICKNCAEK